MGISGKKNMQTVKLLVCLERKSKICGKKFLAMYSSSNCMRCRTLQKLPKERNV